MNKVSIVALSSFLNIEMGQSPEAEFVNTDKTGYPLLNGPAEFTEKFPIPVQYTTNGKRFAEKNDILFCVRGSTTGRINIADQKYAIGRGLAAISHKKGMYLNPFVKGLLEINLNNLLGGTLGSVFPNLTKIQLFDFKCTIPEFRTQQKIASVLSTLDDKIELNNKINAELEAMAKTLYDYWFVQFDFPDDNGKPYKSSGGKMVYNEELKREIPEGWEVKSLEQISDILGGSTPSKEIAEHFTQTGGTPWITPKDLSLNTGNKFIKKGELNVTKLGLQNAGLKVMPKGVVLMSSRAPIGYMAISSNQVTTNQGFKSFVPKSNFPPEFIYYLIQNSLPQIINNASGSTFKEVSGSVLKTLKVCIPNKDLIKEYHVKVSSIFQKQEIIENENQELSNLRDWLLPMLMNGQVTVREAYEKVEQVLSVAAEDESSYSNQTN